MNAQLLPTIGQAFLAGAFFFSLWAMLASLFAQKDRSASIYSSAFRSLCAAGAMTWAAAVCLWIAFFQDRFDIKLVAEYSRTTQPLVYKISALWGGMSGSLLFWAMILSVFMVASAWAFRRSMPGLLPVGTAVMASVHLFFMFLLNWITPPFAPMTERVVDGNGLNPLLQNYWMAIHPPMLYIGYIGFTVPFAFAISALWNRRTDAVWITVTRRWTLFSWFVLGTGILMGGYWAYLELGWGGYWAWDPVENASLIPWLTGAAFIHSVFLQERRGMFKLWNFSLILLTFVLTIYGTFLTRSGVLQSVHAFASSDPSLPRYLQMDVLFGFYIVFWLLALLLLVGLRWKELQADSKIESLLSREASYFYGNGVLLLLAAVTLYGVTAPWIVKWITAKDNAFTQPYYNSKAVPLGVVMLFLMGVAPLLAWKRTARASFMKAVRLPAIVALITAAALPVLFLTVGDSWGWRARLAEGVREDGFFTGYGILAWGYLAVVASVFVITVVARDYFVAGRAKARAKGTLVAAEALDLPFNNPRRFAGLLAHVAVALLVLGVVGSKGFQKEEMKTLRTGESMEIGRWRLVFNKFDASELHANLADTNQMDVSAEVLVYERGSEGPPLNVLYPTKSFYASSPLDEEGRQMPTSEAAMHSTWRGDLYTVLAGYDVSGGTATLLVYVNPFVNLVWAGGVLYALCAIPFLLPPPRKAAERAPVRETAVQSA